MIFSLRGRRSEDTEKGEADDPFTPPPAPEPKWVPWAWARGCLVLTAVLHTAAFPPYGAPEAAWVFAVPAAWWCLRRPAWRDYIVVTFGAMLVSWAILLEWLRVLTREAGPVALLGWLGLAAVVAVFPTLWFLALRWVLPRVTEGGHGGKIAAVLGLAGLWVVQEWVRSWIFTGFPWLPLAASQWQRPAMLQGAAYGGAWIVSFALVVFNLGLAAYLRRLQLWVRARKGRWCPEFYVAMLVIFAVSFGVYGDVAGQQREKLFRAGLMQPYIPQSQKWDPERERANLEIIRQETLGLRYLTPEVVFGPEAVTPVPLVSDRDMQAWVEKLARDLGQPLVFGAVAFEADQAAAAAGEDGRWSNAVFVIDPEAGLQPQFYRKRHLVPFGEYLPFRGLLPFMDKIVPIGGDFTAGEDASPVLLQAGGRLTQVGALICYEDVFPGLARKTAAAGADVLFVATNNAWFGETGAAYQHAAHSVLRAIETRRPLIRVGNGGWSGWIDEYGSIRAVVRDQRKSIHHRGGNVFAIDRDTRWAGRDSFYVRYGDWFIAFAAALALGCGWFIWRSTRSAAAPLAVRVPSPASDQS